MYMCVCVCVCVCIQSDHIYIHGWVSLLYSRNWHNTVNWLYCNKKIFLKKQTDKIKNYPWLSQLLHKDVSIHVMVHLACPNRLEAACRQKYYYALYFMTFHKHLLKACWLKSLSEVAVIILSVYRWCLLNHNVNM